MAFVDANIPIYAAGREHPLKEPCANIIRAIANHPDRYVTDAEVLQELLHHYLRTQRWEMGRRILARFETLLQGRIEPVYPEDVLEASRIADDTPRASARDLVHVSVMRRVGTELVISTDADFDAITGVRRLNPAELTHWQAEFLP